MAKKTIEEIAKGLLADLWETHFEDLTSDHGGDETCSRCDLMREAASLLGLNHPSDASFTTSPTGPLYEEK